MKASIVSRGFTLIELLVVISIIALLVGVLLPALSSARDSSKTSICASRVKQMLTAWSAYEVDYKCVMPSYDYSMQPGYYNYWWGRSSGTGTMALEDGAGFMSPYFPRGSVDACPAFDRVDLQNHFGFVSYGYNWNMVPNEANGYGRLRVNGIRMAKRFDDIVRPSDKFIFADATRISVTSGTLKMTASGWLGTGSAARGVFDTDAFNGRHKGYGNVGWADGHVGRREPSYYSASTPSTAGTAPTATWSDANSISLMRPNFVGHIDNDGDPGTRECAILTQ